MAMLKHGVEQEEVSRLGWVRAEIKEDQVRLPAAEGADGDLVDAGDKEGGGAPGAEG